MNAGSFSTPEYAGLSRELNEDFLPNNKYAPNQDYNHSDPLRIAKAFLDPATFFQGAMDDIRIYNRALSADEIAALATEDCN